MGETISLKDGIISRIAEQAEEDITHETDTTITLS